MPDIGIKFRGHAFSAVPQALQLWFDLLHAQIVKLNSPPDWLSAVAKKWVGANVIPSYGCKGPHLDDFLTDGERVALFSDLGRQALAQLEPFLQSGKPYVSRMELGILWNSSAWNHLKAPPAYLASIGQAFVDLLAGRISESLDNPRVLDKSPYGTELTCRQSQPQPRLLLRNFTRLIDPFVVKLALFAGMGMLLFSFSRDFELWRKNKPLLTGQTMLERLALAQATWLVFFLFSVFDTKTRREANGFFSLCRYFLINSLLGSLIVLVCTLVGFLLTFVFTFAHSRL